MPFDGLTLKKLMKHLKDIKGTVLRQIYQPRKNEYYFQFSDFLLRVSLKPEFSFVSISEKFWDELPYPSNFVMLLRSQVKSARVMDIFQLDFDRVLVMDLKKLRESGEVKKFRLVIELMGKFSNIILIDLETSKIVDAHRRISTRFRDIQPNFRFNFYKNDQKKPFEILPEDLIPKNGNFKKSLLRVLQGFSPLLVDEVLHRAKLERKSDDVNEYVNLLREKIKEVALEVINDPGMYLYMSQNILDIVGTRLQMFSNDNYEYFENPFEALERFFTFLCEHEQFKSKINTLMSIVRSKREKVERALEILEKQIRKYDQYENYKKIGELIMTNLHSLEVHKQNLEKVKLYDWETNEEMEVEIDPSKSILENARIYFERYKKYKGKYAGTKIRYDKLKREYDYLNQLFYYLDNTRSLEDIESIEEEIIDVGLLKSRKSKSVKARQNQEYKFYEFDGFKIFVGKNNKQNDELTFKIANKSDLWFHAKEIPGSHVILKLDGRKSNERVIEYAAFLAAKHSKASQSSKVAVDYTEVKNVWKPKGAKPGFVLYKNYRTIFVNPQKPSEKIQ